MTYEPPGAPATPSLTTAAPPVPPAPPTPQGGDTSSAAGPTRLLGLTSDGNTVKVRQWSRANDVIARSAQAMLCLTALYELAASTIDLQLLAVVRAGDLDTFLVAATWAERLLSPTAYVVLGTVVLFLFWLHRVWTSDRSAHNVYTRSTGVAVGGWLIPVANLVLGPSALRDVWHGTDNARRGVYDGPVDRSTPGPVIAWWAFALLTVVSTVVERVLLAWADGLSPIASLMPTLEAHLGMRAAGSALSATTAVLLVLVIRRIMAFTRR